MLKKIAAEFNFRSGRRRQDVGRLSLAARQNRYDFRSAIELSRLGAPQAICQSILLALSGLREYAKDHPLDVAASEFIQLAAQELSASRGQYFQDVAAYYFSGKKRQGYFVEVGTGDGESLSNTFMLERRFAWQGVLFEPDRRFHESIRQVRTAPLDVRPVYSRDDAELQFLEVSCAGELSTLSDFRHEDGRRRSGATRSVRTVSLNTALASYGAPQLIDYLSIDTEGSELEVLRGLDFHAYDVRFLTIEHNFVPGKREALVDYLAPYGFEPVLAQFSCQDAWFVKSSL